MPASEPEYEALSPERSSAEGCDRATGVECSSSPDGDPSTPMSPAVLLRRSRGSDDDMWEALDFSATSSGKHAVNFQQALSRLQQNSAWSVLGILCREHGKLGRWGLSF